MKKRKLLLLMIALLVLPSFITNIHHASATPVSPYIMVIPSSLSISEFPEGERNFTVTITTDYFNSSYDLWGYHIQLVYNASFLECIEVNNGNLITEDEDPTARFNVTINQAIGEVSIGAYFYYLTPPPYTTSGPGTLASVTFRVLDVGTSALTLGKATKLQRFNFVKNRVENIIIADEQPDNMGHGAVLVTIPGDVNFDRTVDVFDILKIKYHRSGPPPGPGGFNPDADVNQDGLIDVFDILIAKAHLGESW